MTPGHCILNMVTEFHRPNVPFGFISRFGMLIMYKWPRLNLGVGGLPHMN